jgi:flagellin-like protein
MLNATMNIRTLRMKNSKKAVTPVIATIILIAATIVLALVVGAYTFGLFGSNVKTVTLSSATLYGGAETPSTSSPALAGATYLVFSLNNPGSASSISSVTLTGSGISSVSAWDLSGSASNIAFASTNNVANSMPGGAVTAFSYYAVGTQTITTGQVYNYVINFLNGQSVSGSLIAQ